MPLDEVQFSMLPEAQRLKKIADETAAGKVVNFGLVHEDVRTSKQNEQIQESKSTAPRFGIRGHYRLNERRYALWMASRALLGVDPQWVWQVTGSCVGASHGNMLMVSMGVEIHLQGDREEYRWPFWPYTYGRGRLAGGMRGRGEGSYGDAQRQAALKDGHFELDPEGEPDLPDPANKSGWAQYPSSVELEWSDGGRIAANWLRVGQTHLFKSAAFMRSSEDCIAALANGYCITAASMFGFSPMVPPLEGKSPNQVRLVRRWNGSWAHQMFIVEFWDHPDLGPIFGWGNNWGPTAHNPGGQTPSGYPDCMYYTTAEVVDQVCKSRGGEVIAYSTFDGFPARESELQLSDFSMFGVRT